jgi:hypothetical protein
MYTASVLIASMSKGTVSLPLSLALNLDLAFSKETVSVAHSSSLGVTLHAFIHPNVGYASCTKCWLHFFVVGLLMADCACHKFSC